MNDDYTGCVDRCVVSLTLVVAGPLVYPRSPRTLLFGRENLRAGGELCFYGNEDFLWL